MAQKTQRSRAFPPTLCHRVARIFLTAPLSHEVVALHRGQCDTLVRYEKLATSPLGKKIKELMSMIAKNKQEKERYLAFIFDHLWRGNTQEVLRYLRTEVNAKHPGKLSELIGYLEKHQGEIIDDERRQKAGKTIGSGRMEKGVDQVIGFRQKKKGMSWR